MRSLKQGTLHVQVLRLEDADAAWQAVLEGGEGWACCTSQVFGWRKLQPAESLVRGTILSAETWKDGVSRHLRYDDGEGLWTLREYSWRDQGEMQWEQISYLTTTRNKWWCSSKAPSRMEYGVWWSPQPDPIDQEIKVLRPHAGIFMGWSDA